MSARAHKRSERAEFGPGDAILCHVSHISQSHCNWSMKQTNQYFQSYERLCLVAEDSLSHKWLTNRKHCFSAVRATSILFHCAVDCSAENPVGPLLSILATQADFALTIPALILFNIIYYNLYHSLSTPIHIYPPAQKCIHYTCTTIL